MAFELNSLVRTNILALKPYSSARDEFSGQEGVFLDANENSFGSVLVERPLHRYPDPLQHKLKQKIAEQEDCEPAQIFLGNGSDEAIDLLMRIFCEPNQDCIMTLPPTYGMYEVSAAINAVSVKEVPLLPEVFQIDLPELQAKLSEHCPKLLFICSPNNPTANLIAAETVEQILNDFEGIVVLDEAYIDFCKEASFLPKLRQYPNLVILRTFSKAWGLAGIRLGMAFASPEIISLFNKVKPPYNVNLLTQQEAYKALRNLEFKETLQNKVIESRTELEKELGTLDCVLKIYPSDANFILIKVEDANDLYDYLVEHRVVVRNRSKVIENTLRITVGTPAENEMLISALLAYEVGN